MYVECRYPGCTAWKKDHDNSNAIVKGLCDTHREIMRIRNMLPKRRGPVKPFSDYNPRPARVHALRNIKLVIETASVC